MLRLFVLSALVAFVFCNVILSRAALPDGRIVGGVATTVEAHPHQVSIRYYGQHRCGGSIIGRKKVLTAGHCCSGLEVSSIKVQHGVTDIGTSVNLVSLAQMIVHPDYNNLDYDACVITLVSDIVYSARAQPIEVARSEPFANARAVVTGWGATTQGGGSPRTLQAVEVLIFSRQECNSAYEQYGGITENMVCAGLKEGGADSCQGDSGGPLVSGGKLVGIVSWGVGCAQRGFPGVYTNVARLSNWILTQ